MTIKEIYVNENLSVRSYHVCAGNGLRDLTAILRHYIQYKTFKNLRNCGKKSDQELSALCLKYFDTFDGAVIENPRPENPLIQKIANLTRTQSKIVNSFIEIRSKNLSNRSKNALNAFLNENLKITNISEKILTNEQFNMYQIRNVGKKSVIELARFIDSLKEFIEKVSDIENESDLAIFKNRFLIEKTFAISDIPHEIIKSQSFFVLVNYLLKLQDASPRFQLVGSEISIVDDDPSWQIMKKKKNHKREKTRVIFDDKMNLVFQQSFKIYNNQYIYTTDEIAQDLDISRERARQLRKICVDELFDKLRFIKNIDEDLFQKYSIDINQNFIQIDEDLISHINELNNTNFSIEFISYLLYVYLSDDFALVGNIEDVMLKKSFNSRNRHNWSRFYLVRKFLCSEFDFNDLTHDIYRRMNERIEEDYSFNFSGYLIDFLKKDNPSVVTIVSAIAELIISQEFDLLIDLNDNIVFKRNTIKQVSEYAIEALEKLGTPSKIEELYQQVKKDYPEVTKNQETLRTSLQRTPGIIYFGRSSTYGLKKWEHEKEGVKGGTIKDIVLDYLRDKNDPIHILELVNEVHKYREKTTAKNVITNLKLDSNKQFVIFNQSFIGINGKKYNSNLSCLPKFLGKTITSYVRDQIGIDRSHVEEYFSSELDISPTSVRYIIDNLIENDFIHVDNHNILTI